jgi:uncharacterized protein involved in exopolysaccharide biosynthesis
VATALGREGAHASVTLTFLRKRIVTMENRSYRRSRLSRDDLSAMQNGGPAPAKSAVHPKAHKKQAKKSLHEVIELLRNGSWLIVTVLVLVTAGAVVITLTTPPEYKADSLLLVNLQNNQGGPNDALTMGYVDGLAFTNRNLSNQALILQ